MVGNNMVDGLVGIVDMEGAVVMLLIVVMVGDFQQVHGRVRKVIGERGRPRLRRSRHGLPRQAEDEEDRSCRLAHGAEYTEIGVGCESFAIVRFLLFAQSMTVVVAIDHEPMRVALRYTAVIGLKLPPPPTIESIAVRMNLEAQLIAVAAEIARRTGRG